MGDWNETTLSALPYHLKKAEERERRKKKREESERKRVEILSAIYSSTSYILTKLNRGGEGASKSVTHSAGACQ